MNRRDFLAGMGGGAMALAGMSSAIPADRRNDSRPNILVILSDDAGFADFGFQGSVQFRTPRIDSIARNGVRFTDGYVSASVCSPTRAGLLTGRYQQRFGHEYNLPRRPEPGDSKEWFGMSTDETTIADQLSKAGYTTGAIGKWHLGYEDKFHPLNRGFDEFYGFIGGSCHYYPRKKPPIVRGRKEVEPSDYLTDDFGREACSFIERHRQEPFFLYLAPNAVHGPMEATPEDEARFSNLGKKRRTLAGMTWALDRMVGNVLNTLRKHDLEKNTLLFFVNDNGGRVPQGCSNAPLNGMKGTFLEGGIRVPFTVQWPGRLPAGVDYGHPVSSLDIFTTAMAVAGRSLPDDREYDGVDLLPYLTGHMEGMPHETLYWRRAQCAAIRDRQWKLIRMPDRPPMLFNLARDIGEQNNVSALHRDVVERLMKKLFSWENELAHPLWRTDPIWIKRNVELYDREYDLTQPGA